MRILGTEYSTLFSEMLLRLCVYDFRDSPGLEILIEVETFCSIYNK